MKVVKCVNGHFYDKDRYEECPHCRQNPGGKRSYIAGKKKVGEVIQKNMRSDNEKTVGIFNIECREPITGWLVCVEGNKKGYDYRIHAGRNYIGRLAGQDISIPEDDRISPENDCSIIFEPKKVQFLLMRGRGEKLYVNGEKVEGSTLLHADDLLAIGDSQFVFIPFCRNGRTWFKQREKDE